MKTLLAVDAVVRVAMTPHTLVTTVIDEPKDRAVRAEGHLIREVGQAMRSFMSVRPIGDGLYPELACVEARAVLSAVEPIAGDSNYWDLPVWPTGLPRPSDWYGPLVERVLVNVSANRRSFALLPSDTDARALADSLSRFLAAPDAALYLSQLQEGA